MNILHWGSNILKTTSPAGLIIGGTVLALSLPVIRKGLRCLAVTTARGVYSLVEDARNTSMHMSHDKEAH